MRQLGGSKGLYVPVQYYLTKRHELDWGRGENRGTARNVKLLGLSIFFVSVQIGRIVAE